MLFDMGIIKYIAQKTVGVATTRGERNNVKSRAATRHDKLRR